MSTTEDHKENQVYELSYLVLPSVAEENLSDVVNAIKGIVKKVKGEEIASEDPIQVNLAYTMTKVVGARKYVVDDAYIGWVKFECGPDCMLEVHDAMKKLDEILRFLVVRAPRETTFTFAQALRRREEMERAKEAEKMAPADQAEKVAEKVVE